MVNKTVQMGNAELFGNRRIWWPSPRTMLSSCPVKKGRVEQGMSRSAWGCAKLGRPEGRNNKGTSFFYLIVFFQALAETDLGANQNCERERGAKMQIPLFIINQDFDIHQGTADFSYCPNPDTGQEQARGHHHSHQLLLTLQPGCLSLPSR